MKKFQECILVFAGIALLLTGCTESPPPVVETDLQTHRLKIADLGPSELDSIKVQCVFSVVPYRLPVKSIKSIPEALSMLSDKGLRMEDPDGFSANGFWAAEGPQTVGPNVVTALQKLGAERIGIKKFLLFQEYSEEITGLPITMGQSVFYFRDDGTLTGRRVPGGRLSLVLSAQPDTPRKKMAEVRIETVFRQTSFPNLSSLSQGSLVQSISFKEGSLQATMAEGDFIILAATKIQQDSNTLSHLFLDFRSDEPVAILYLILCQQAGE